MPRVSVRLADRGPSRDWLVPALGGVLTAATLGHFAVHEHGDSMVVAATVLPAAAVLAYGTWFWLAGPQAARGDAVLTWGVGGAGAVLAFDLWALTVNAYAASATPSHVFIQHTSLGALGGAVAGTYSQRDRHQARAHERLRRALDAAMDGVAVLDDDGQIAYANDAFCDDYGADDSGAVVGTHWTAYYPSESQSRLSDVFPAFENGNRDYWHGKVVARRADSHTYPQELSMTPIEDGYVWVARDVTDREARDQRLRVLNRVLRHNVRNSLNVVLGHADRLENRVDGEGAERIVAAAEDLLAVSEKARVVEQVLDTDDPGTAPLGDVVAAEVDRARSNHPDVDFDVSVDADAEVDARLRLAVRELLANAVEHNDADDRRVTVEATDGGPDAADGSLDAANDDLRATDDDLAQPDHVAPAARVSDNGSGIPEHERRALEGVEEAPLRHGSGIGLWVVYWLAQRVGATVDVEDASTVVVRLPAGEQPQN